MSEKLFIVPESDLKNLLNLNRKDISDYQEIPWWANALADVRGTQLCDFVEIKTRGLNDRGFRTGTNPKAV